MPNKNKLVRYFDYLIDARQKVNCPNSDCNFKGFGMPACTLDSNQNIRFGFGGFLIMISILLQYWFIFEPQIMEIERSIKTFFQYLLGSSVCFTLGILLIRFRHDAYTCPQCWLELPTKTWKELDKLGQPQKIPTSNFWT